MTTADSQHYGLVRSFVYIYELEGLKFLSEDAESGFERDKNNKVVCQPK